MKKTIQDNKILNIKDFPDYVQSEIKKQYIFDYVMTGLFAIGDFYLRDKGFFIISLIIVAFLWGATIYQKYMLTHDKVCVIDGTCNSLVPSPIPYIKTQTIKIVKDNDMCFIPYKVKYKNRYKEGVTVSVYAANSGIRVNGRGEYVIDYPMFVFWNV